MLQAQHAQDVSLCVQKDPVVAAKLKCAAGLASLQNKKYKQAVGSQRYAIRAPSLPDTSSTALKHKPDILADACSNPEASWIHV